MSTRIFKRSTRRRDTRSPRTVVGTGVAVLAVLAVLGLLALRSSNGLPLVDYRTLYAEVPDAGNLQPHNEVRLNGVRVGQVITVAPRSAGGARIEMKLVPDSGPLPPDTSVRVRGAGLLGQRYVDVRPGTTAGDLPDGATVKGGHDALASDVPEVLKTFDERTRDAFATVINELGKGLDGRGEDLNRGVRAAPVSAHAFQKVADAIFERPRAARHLMPSIAAATTSLDAARDPIARMLRPTADGLQPLADNPEELGRALEELPPTLQTVRPALAESRALLRAARSLAGAAEAELPPAPAALRSTAALLRHAREPLARTTRLLSTASAAVPHVLKITDAASPVLAPLRQTLSDLDPVVAQLGKHDCDLDNFAENWRSALGYGVPGTGQDTPLPSGDIGGLGLFRVTLLAGPPSVQRFSTLANGSVGPDPYPGRCVSSPGPEYVEPDLVRGSKRR